MPNYSLFVANPLFEILLPVGIVGGLAALAFALRHFITALIFNIPTVALDLIDARQTKLGRRLTAAIAIVFFLFTIFLACTGRWQITLAIYVALAILGITPRGLVRGALTVAMAIAGIILLIIF